jgi:hypothetical protein
MRRWPDSDPTRPADESIQCHAAATITARLGHARPHPRPALNERFGLVDGGRRRPSAACRLKPAKC